MATKRYTTMPATIEFEGVELRIIDRQGRPWVTQDDLVKALYGIKGEDTSVPPFGSAARAVRRLLDKNRDEFADNMTAILTMETAGGPQQVRIFSARGAYLMGMFAKTDRAKHFRRWVLDVLEGKIDIAAQRQSGRSRAEQAEQRLLINSMHAATRMVDVIRRACGNRPAALAAPGIFAKLGIEIDLTGSDTLAQGELPLAEAVETVH